MLSDGNSQPAYSSVREASAPATSTSVTKPAVDNAADDAGNQPSAPPSESSVNDLTLVDNDLYGWLLLINIIALVAWLNFFSQLIFSFWHTRALGGYRQVRYAASTVQASLPVCHARMCQHPDITEAMCLGVLFDSSLTFAPHVRRLTSKCFYHLRRMTIVRRSLTEYAATKAIVHAFVTSRVGYCNGVIHRVSIVYVKPLQNKLIAVARIILRKRKSDCITAHLWDQLHWLLVAPISGELSIKCVFCSITDQAYMRQHQPSSLIWSFSFFFFF